MENTVRFLIWDTQFNLPCMYDGRKGLIIATGNWDRVYFFDVRSHAQRAVDNYGSPEHTVRAIRWEVV